MPGPLILAYDAECELCCRMAHWLRVRDRWGLLVLFPLQNKELVLVAPELAGQNLRGEVHGLDERTRRVWKGAELLPHVLARLPAWRWVAPVLRVPGIRRCSAWAYMKLAELRYKRTGRPPFVER